MPEDRAAPETDPSRMRAQIASPRVAALAVLECFILCLTKVRSASASDIRNGWTGRATSPYVAKRRPGTSRGKVEDLIVEQARAIAFLYVRGRSRAIGEIAPSSGSLAARLQAEAEDEATRFVEFVQEWLAGGGGGECVLSVAEQVGDARAIVLARDLFLFAIGHRSERGRSSDARKRGGKLRRAAVAVGKASHAMGQVPAYAADARVLEDLRDHLREFAEQMDALAADEQREARALGSGREREWETEVATRLLSSLGKRSDPILRTSAIRLAASFLAVNETRMRERLRDLRRRPPGKRGKAPTASNN